MPVLLSRECWKEHFPQLCRGEPGLLIWRFCMWSTNRMRTGIFTRICWKSGELTVKQIHEIALENLDRYFEDNQIELICMSREDGPNMIIQSKPDAYNASQVLSKSFYQQARRFLGSEFLAGVPNRDFLLGAKFERVTDHRKNSAQYRQ